VLHSLFEAVYPLFSLSQGWGNFLVRCCITVYWVSVRQIFIVSLVLLKLGVSGWFFVCDLGLHTHPLVAAWGIASASFTGVDKAALYPNIHCYKNVKLTTKTNIYTYIKWTGCNNKATIIPWKDCTFLNLALSQLLLMNLTTFLGVRQAKM